MKTMKLGQPMAEKMTPSPTKSEPMYPTMHIDHPMADKIPNKGSAHIKFHVGARNMTMHKGKKKHSATLHVHSFLPMAAARPQTDDEAIEAQLGQMDNEAAEGPGGQ